MSDHLSGERLSALLDTDAPAAEEQRHLDACSECEEELHRLRRMRMALSAMDDLQAPDDGWERVAAALPGEPEASGGAADVGARPARSRIGPWARVAAAVALFAGGLALGTHLSGPGGEPDRAATAGEAEAPRVAAPEGRGSAPDRVRDADAASTDGAVAARLSDLESEAAPPLEAYRNPTAAAERLTRLDAVLEAARQAVREDPSDPAMNDLLFRVAEGRQALVDALHLASLEYR